MTNLHNANLKLAVVLQNLPYSANLRKGDLVALASTECSNGDFYVHKFPMHNTVQSDYAWIVDKSHLHIFAPIQTHLLLRKIREIPHDLHDSLTIRDLLPTFFDPQ